jgi:hypothetical protein
MYIDDGRALLAPMGGVWASCLDSTPKKRLLERSKKAATKAASTNGSFGCSAEQV